MQIRDYDVRATTTAGALIAFLPNANLHRVTWQLNHPGSIEFSMSIYDPQTLYIRKYTEIQVWRRSTLIWWGPVVKLRVDDKSGRITFQCQGLLWYLLRRFIGKADRTNLMLNPQFESAGANWDDFGGTTFTTDGTDVKEGALSAKLVHAAAVEAGIRQDISVTSGTVGEVLTGVAWSKVLSAGFTAGGFNGLQIEVLTPITLVRESFDATDQLTNGSKDSWIRHEVQVEMPPSVTKIIRLTGFDVHGTVRWDSFSLTKMESLSFYATEQATVFAAVIAHLQDPAYGKNNVNITTSTPATGVNIDKHYQFAEHEKGDTVIEEFRSRSNGFDFGIVLSPTTRVLTTSFPRKGSYKPDYRLNNRNIIEYNYTDDGEEGISSLTILGEGDGPDREEGSAIDAGIYGGLILEDVEVASASTDISLLDVLAQEKLRVRKDPRSLFVTVDNASVPIIENVFDGDTIPINLFDGYIQVSEDMRVISKTIAPHKEHVTLELNPA